MVGDITETFENILVITVDRYLTGACQIRAIAATLTGAGITVSFSL